MKPSILGYYLRHEIRTGGHKRYLELLNALSKIGWNVTVILSNTIDTKDFSFNIVSVKPVYRGKVPYSLKQCFRVFPYLLKLPKGSWRTIVFGETNYLTVKLANIVLKAKVVFAFRSNSYKAKLNEYKEYNKKLNLKKRFGLYKMLKIEKNITKLSDLLIFQTTFDRDDILNRSCTDKNKSVIIPNSLRESWFDDSYKYKNSSSSLKKLIYLGNYDDRKGAIFLLQAFKILKDKNIDLKLDLFGKGNDSIKLQKYIEDVGLTDRVVVHGGMNNPISKLSKYDLMIVPSIYDSYPNVILESIFTGTPVLGSDNSGMSAILDNPQLLFKTGDPDDIASKIEEIYNDEKLYKEVHSLCRKRAEYHDFSWPEKFSNVLETLN
ncbi:MAG: glycosyltransferase family 4 protein [Spirochaetaceae bacterium]